MVVSLPYSIEQECIRMVMASSSRHSYLINAANQIYNLTDQTSTPELENLATAATQGCNTFRRLTQDEAFFRAVAELRQNREENLEAFNRVTANAEAFEVFLRAERDLLFRSDLNEMLVSRVMLDIQVVSSLVQQLVQGAQLNQQVLRQHIERLERSCCAVADVLNQRRVDQEGQRRMASLLRRVTWGVVGGVVIFVNATPMAAQIDPFGAGIAISGALGETLMGGLLGG
jgi:hypothetical protein